MPEERDYRPQQPKFLASVNEYQGTSTLKVITPDQSQEHIYRPFNTYAAAAHFAYVRFGAGNLVFTDHAAYLRARARCPSRPQEHRHTVKSQDRG